MPLPARAPRPASPEADARLAGAPGRVRAPDRAPAASPGAALPASPPGFAGADLAALARLPASGAPGLLAALGGTAGNRSAASLAAAAGPGVAVVGPRRAAGAGPGLGAGAAAGPGLGTGAGPVLAAGAGAGASTAIQRERTVQRDGPDDEPGGTGGPDASGEGPEATAEPGEAAEARAAEARAQAILTNERFTGIRRLAELVRGGRPLSSRDNGPTVRAVQQALLDIGYSLLRHERDGRWGGETEAAVRQFRTDHGLEGDGGMDAEAMEALDGAAPPPGTATQHSVDYERLLADGRLDMTIAIGYDEHKGHLTKITRAHEYLPARGFQQADGEGPDAPVEHWTQTRDISYPTRGGERATRSVVVSLTLIKPGQGAAAAFGNALADSEITVYTGHARRGIGPDFDEDRSPAENFIVGVGSALHAAGRAVEPSRVEQNHYVIDRVNDLEQMTQAGRFDRERYRLWFFNACTTLAYMDELRGGILPEGMDRQSLDLMGTTHTVPTSAGLDTSFALLDGVLAADSMEAIVRTMGGIASERAAAEGFTAREIRDLRTAYFREGAADNPEVPAAP